MNTDKISKSGSAQVVVQGHTTSGKHGNEVSAQERAKPAVVELSIK